MLLRKGFPPYEYMDEWEKFNEITLPEKEFYSNLNMQDYRCRLHACKKEFLKTLK